MKFITVAGSAGFFGVMLSIGTGLIRFFYLAGPSASSRELLAENVGVGQRSAYVQKVKTPLIN
jgi:hypothetical protein